VKRALFVVLRNGLLDEGASTGRAKVIEASAEAPWPLATSAPAENRGLGHTAEVESPCRCCGFTRKHLPVGRSYVRGQGLITRNAPDWRNAHQSGSDVYDGSVRARLAALEKV